MAQNAQKIAPETITVAHDTHEVMCDGGVGPLGHPRVWYTFDGKNEVSCHYCGRKFVKSEAE